MIFMMIVVMIFFQLNWAPESRFFRNQNRHSSKQEVPDIVCPSAGIHIVLPDYYSPSNMGLLDPATSDGRVIFFLPWQGSTIAGTTDSPTEVTHSPSPSEGDIQGPNSKDFFI